mmetsp:Transcript_46383/g.87067  ORF Transcript_46383/g.87067 Transcript_46383/m.87067 type:complete len:222 (-) Transcript_46383:454-1119(-)
MLSSCDCFLEGSLKLRLAICPNLFPLGEQYLPRLINRWIRCVSSTQSTKPDLRIDQEDLEVLLAGRLSLRVQQHFQRSTLSGPVGTSCLVAEDLLRLIARLIHSSPRSAETIIQSLDVSLLPCLILVQHRFLAREDLEIFFAARKHVLFLQGRLKFRQVEHAHPVHIHVGQQLRSFIGRPLQTSQLGESRDVLEAYAHCSSAVQCLPKPAPAQLSAGSGTA